MKLKCSATSPSYYVLFLISVYYAVKTVITSKNLCSGECDSLITYMYMEHSVMFTFSRNDCQISTF